MQLFHAPGFDDDGFATIKVEDHLEHWPVTSKSFKRWISRLYYKDCHKASGSQALNDAINVLTSKALFEGSKYPVAVRLAQHDGVIYLDLVNEQWQVVKISDEGWEIISDPPIRFIRRRGMEPLPMPVAGGNLNDLRELVNIGEDNAWVLFVSWMVAALRPDRPFPILCVNGEQGSAKSTLCKMARSL